MPTRYSKNGARRAVLTTGDASGTKKRVFKRDRACPKCGAAPGASCTRNLAARIDGKVVGSGYDRILLSCHKER